MSTSQMVEALFEAEDTREIEESVQVEALKTLDAEVVRDMVLAKLRGDAGEDLLAYIQRCIDLGEAPMWMRVPESELIGRAIARLVNGAMAGLVMQRMVGASRRAQP